MSNTPLPTCSTPASRRATTASQFRVRAGVRHMAALAISAIIFSGYAQAANTTLFWDASGVNSGQGGTGAWDTSSALWDTAATGGTMQQWPNTTPSTFTANFGGTAGTVTIASGVTINVNALVFTTTGYVINGTDGTSFLNLDGVTPTITTGAGNTATINAIITGSAGLTKASDTGVLVLGGANTYTGNTSILGGTVSVSSIGSTSSTSSGFGSTGTTINLGLTTAATLKYTGTGETTDRIINMAGTTAGVTIDQSGASGLLKFTGNFTAGGAGIKTLTLQGSTAATGEISGTISDNSSVNKTSVTKTGTGTWTLSGSNAYTGATLVNNGTLLLTHTGAVTNSALAVSGSATGVTAVLTASAINAITGTSSLSLGATGGSINTVTLSASNNFTGAVSLGNNVNNTLILSDFNAIANASSLSVVSGTLVLLSNVSGTFNTPNMGGTTPTISVGNNGSGSGNALAMSGGVTLGNNRTTTITGANGYSLVLPNVNISVGTSGGSLNPISANVSVGTINNLNTTSGTAPIILTGTNTDNTVTGQISNGTGGAVTALKVSGSDRWTLSASNSYTGPTTISSGTLVAANKNALGDSSAPLVMTGGVLDLATDTSIVSYNTTVSGVSTILSDKATASSAGITHTLGTLSMGAGTFNAAAGTNVSGGSPVIAFGAATLNSTLGVTSVINPTTASVTLASVTNLAPTTKVNTLQLDGTSAGNQITGIIDNGVSSGTTTIIKANTSSWILSGANTYTGGTTIKDGTLVIGNSTGSATGTGTVTLTGSSGAAHATLSGNGAISGSVILTGTGAAIGAAHLAPGTASTAGTLTLGNGLTIGNGTNLDFGLGSTSSLISVTGNLSLGSNVVLNPTAFSGFALNTQYDLINYTGTLTGNTSTWTASSLPGGATSATFAVVTVGGTNEITVTFNGSGGTTSTSYTLTASAGSTNILTGGTTRITSVITNVGTGSADTLNYTGLGASSGSGGSVSGSTTNGTGLAQGASGTNAGQIFTGTQSGAVVVTPTGSGTNGTLGGAATATGTTSVTVNVFDAASLSGAQSGTGTVVALTALNQSGTFRAAAKVTVDNGLSNNQGFTNVAVTPGTQINPGNSVTVASFDKTNRLNGIYTATKGLGYDNVTSSGSAITGGTGNTTNVGLSVTVSGQTAGAGQTFTATLFSGQKYGTTTGSTSSGYGLTSAIAGDPHTGTTATLINGTASANTTVSMSFNTVPSAGAIHDTTFRTSDILSLGGIVATGTLGPDNSILTDKYVLQLSYDPTAVGAQYIGWYDAVQSQWVNAIAGNSTGGHYDGSGEFVGSYADYLATLTGPQQADLAFQLNAFGYDASTHTAWAVLDHNSEFAVIPEPGTWGMILSGFGMLIGIQRLRRRRVGT